MWVSRVSRFSGRNPDHSGTEVLTKRVAYSRSDRSGSTNACPLFKVYYSCGDAELSLMSSPPEQLSYFFTVVKLQVDWFCSQVRRYNTALGFILLGAEVDLRQSVSMVSFVTGSAPSHWDHPVHVCATLHIQPAHDPQTSNVTERTNTRSNRRGEFAGPQGLIPPHHHGLQSSSILWWFSRKASATMC